MSVLSELTARIDRIDGMLPEHVTSAAADDTDAVLVDQWARVHALRDVTEIGRDGTNQLAVLHTSVSRKHARLAYDAETDAWALTDLGSRNGSVVEGQRLTAERPLPVGDRQLVMIGDVGFVLVLDRHTLPSATPTESYLQTAQSVRPGAELRISAPTTEGAGMVGRGDDVISLGSTQFALLRLLAERWRAEKATEPELRGFVRSVELLANLPWNTARPEDNHLKQQVRRLRKALERLGLADALESRHGFGYRLAVDATLG